MHWSCWSGYRWHQQMNALSLSLLPCNVPIAAGIELIEEAHLWVVSILVVTIEELECSLFVFPMRWVTVIDWHLQTESVLPWCKKHSVISEVFTVRHTMNIQIDSQKTDMAQVLHICVGSLKDCGSFCRFSDGSAGKTWLKLHSSLIKLTASQDESASSDLYFHLIDTSVDSDCIHRLVLTHLLVGM